MQRFLKGLALAAGGIAAALAAFSALAAGRFIYVEGTVTVRDAAGATRGARAGDPINEKESVFVGDGRAQVRFNDGGWVALQPHTVFEVKQFPQREDGNVLMSLLKGGARAVTGFLSERNPARYQMETPTATIGIRGTSFLVTFCAQSCDLPDGLYVTGGDGTIFVKNGFGEIDLSRGRTAYVPNAQTPPRESNVKPMTAIAEPASTQQMAAAGSTTTAELRPGNFIYFQGTSGYVGPFQALAIASGGLAIAASGTLSGQASGVIRGVFESASASSSPGAGAGAGVGSVRAGDSLTLVIDGAQRPVSFTAAASTGERVSGTALTAPELSGSDGILFWGRWTNTKFQFDVTDPAQGTATGSGTLGPASYIHYLVGLPAASVPLSGTATYGFIGGSGSTSQAGTVGAGVTAGTLTANFGSNLVGANLSISHGGTYTATGTASINLGNRAAFSSFTGSTSGAGSHPFSFDGFFAGAGAPTAPARAGMGWQINRPDPIVGTAGFACKTGC